MRIEEQEKYNLHFLKMEYVRPKPRTTGPARPIAAAVTTRLQHRDTQAHIQKPWDAEKDATEHEQQSEKSKPTDGKLARGPGTLERFSTAEKAEKAKSLT